MGISTGCVGMSLRDFFCCTPLEFYAIYAAWQELHTSAEQGAWERSRFVAATLLQPHSRRALRPKDICAFPWESVSACNSDDAPRPEITSPLWASSENSPALKKNSTRERFEALKELWR